MLTFINTLILSALALSLIPVIIHLLNRKKSLVVPFSTLNFLRALEKSKIKKIQIRQILLLLLRTLVLVLAVVAFARPVSKLENRGGVDAHANTSAVLVIDNSVGASYQSEKGAVMDVIKIKAERILDFLKEGDEAAVISLSNPQPASWSQNFTEVKAGIRNIQFGYFKPNLNDALFAADQLLDHAKNVNKEIYVLTNLQRGSFSDEAVPAFQSVPMFMDCSPKKFKNVGITNAQAVSKIIEKNKPVDVSVTVKNFGDENAEGVLASVYLDGRRVGQSSLNIPAHDESALDLKIIPTRTGFISGYVEIDDDAFAADNKRFFHLYVPERVRVLLAGNHLNDTEFLRLALNPSAETGSPVAANSVEYAKLPATNLNDFQVVLFSNVPRFDESLMRRVESFLRAGGGMMIFPGEATDISNYNKTLFEKAGIGKFLSLTDYSRQENLTARFGYVDYTHPVIKGLFDPFAGTVQIASPDFIKFFKLDRSGTSRTIIALSTNSGFVEERHYLNGDILVFASAVNLNWSDWPLKGIFAPLINRCVAYLFSQNYSEPKSFLCGAPIELKIQSASQDGIRVNDINHVEIVPQVKQIGTDIIVKVPKLDTPGNYSVHAKNATTEMFDLNVAAEQGNFEKIPAASMDTVFGNGRYKMIGEDEKIEEFILQSRYGRELWKWVMVCALILLVAEAALAQSHRWSKHESAVKNF